MSGAVTEAGQSSTGKSLRDALLDRAPFLVACLMLVLIVIVYGTRQTGVFTLDEPNLNTTAAMTLMLAATGQTIVLLRGGIDLSIGGMISLGTVIAATRFGDDAGSVVLWSGLILLLGLAVGVVNGLLISFFRLQPFLVTLATWSILNGVAMLILPSDGGKVPDWWLDFGYLQFLGLSSRVDAHRAARLLALVLATRLITITPQAQMRNPPSCPAYRSPASIPRRTGFPACSRQRPPSI